jgi:activator of 2-hydroxyglutaryl-CoA dehydratase
MIIGDAGSSWCKIFDPEKETVQILPTRKMSTDNLHFDWGTGHTARNRSSNFENDLISLTKGALALVEDQDFTVLDLGSRDAKLVGFRGRRPVKLDWSVGCAAATGATVEMIGRFYDIDFNTLESADKWTAVTCGTYALERIMDGVSRGETAEIPVARFIHGLARNTFDFSGKPKRLYLSGGFTLNKAYLDSLSRYTEVICLGRTVPLAGLWAFAEEKDPQIGPIPKTLINGGN